MSNAQQELFDFPPSTMVSSGQDGVLVHGTFGTPRRLTPEEAATCAALTGGWRQCPVPALCGVPLAMLKLPSLEPPPATETLGVWLLISPDTGFAPSDVQMNVSRGCCSHTC